MKLSNVSVLLISTILIIINCTEEQKTCPALGSSEFGTITATNSISISLMFSKTTKYAPSFAVWAADSTGSNTKTIYVTCKAATDSWIGGSKRPESLPVWFGIRNKEGISTDTKDVDGITSATPEGSTFKINWPISGQYLNSALSIYFEANASYDSNDNYDGVNGQPSAIFSATLPVNGNTVDTIPLKLIGCGDVNGSDHAIHSDTTGLTTAKKLITGSVVIHRK